jgi:hypothetical protein
MTEVHVAVKNTELLHVAMATQMCPLYIVVQLQVNSFYCQEYEGRYVFM